MHGFFKLISSILFNIQHYDVNKVSNAKHTQKEQSISFSNNKEAKDMHKHFL